jgi:plasmid stability protein
MPTFLAYTAGMKNRLPIQYTIRNIPAEVDRRLRENARRGHRSLNRTLIDLLSQAAGASTAGEAFRDLDAFFGSWTADSEVDAALREQRKIDRKLWR